jgi:hypothetical protein
LNAKESDPWPTVHNARSATLNGDFVPSICTCKQMGIKSDICGPTLTLQLPASDFVSLKSHVILALHEVLIELGDSLKDYNVTKNVQIT